jgi:hypothetical protein
MLNDQSQAAQNFLAKHIHVRANLLINELLEKSQRDWNLDQSSWYEHLFCQSDVLEENPNSTNQS